MDLPKTLLPAPDGSVDLTGVVDESVGVRYLSRATRLPDGRYQCLADVGGRVCRVEVTLRTEDGRRLGASEAPAEPDVESIETTLSTGIPPYQQARKLIDVLVSDAPPGMTLTGALQAAIIADVNARGGLTEERAVEWIERLRLMRRKQKHGE